MPDQLEDVSCNHWQSQRYASQAMHTTCNPEHQDKASLKTKESEQVNQIKPSSRNMSSLRSEKLTSSNSMRVYQVKMRNTSAN